MSNGAQRARRLKCERPGRQLLGDAVAAFTPRAVGVWARHCLTRQPWGRTNLGSMAPERGERGERGVRTAKWVWVCLPCLTKHPPASEESFVARDFESHPSATVVQSANPVTRAALLTLVGQAKISRARIKRDRYFCPTCGTWGYRSKGAGFDPKPTPFGRSRLDQIPVWIGSASRRFVAGIQPSSLCSLFGSLRKYSSGVVLLSRCFRS
jgi:hypothetical protein